MTRFLSSAALVLAFSAGIAAAQDADTVVARVGDTEITLGHVLALEAQIPEQYKSYPDDVLFQALLDQLVQQTLLAQTVENIGRAEKLGIENEERSFLAAVAMNALMDAAVTEEAVTALYEETYPEGEGPMEWNASHILVETEDEAKAIIEELNGGADFAETAKEKSTGPSGPNGGELGWFGPGRMVPEFEAAVQDMEVDGISAPVQTQFGWHVIKLNDARRLPQPELAQVAEALAEQIQGKALSDRLDELAAEIEVERPGDDLDPALIRRLELLDD